MPSESNHPETHGSEERSLGGSATGWKKFALFSCGDRYGIPYLHFEILWTPILKGRLASHAWLDDTGWKTFVETAEVGEVFDGKGVIIAVRLKEAASDYER